MPSCLKAALAALAVLLLCAAPARAASSLDVGIADDRVLLQGSDAQVAEAADEFARLGIDVVRIVARWGSHVPQPESRTRPEGFDPSDPTSTGYRWQFLDRAVDAVRSRGMRVVLSVTGSGPVWATQDPSKDNPRLKPVPRRFAEFATAVARHLGARVDQYVVWNEPNLPLWLQPQSTCRRGRCIPYAPHLYRRLFNAAAPAIRAADPGADVLAGALAPRGENARSSNAKLRPLAFLRAMGCVDSRWRRVRSGLCAGFSPVEAEGLAHHPHSTLAAPTGRSRHPDDAQMGDLGRLTTAVDRIQRAGGLRVRGASRMPLYLTEYGYQTRPPDVFAGVSLSQQSTWLQQGSYVAWRHPRVRMLVQYVWRDEPLSRGGAGWQSGLRRSDGRAKPALSTFDVPFWAERRDRRSVRVWGQVRPGADSEVRIERASRGNWVRVATLRTTARGFYDKTFRVSSSSRWRARTEAGITSTRAVR
ncbi:MAG TPA: cellulase family glycosylhydrolase [Baekduia sp.]|nr:cellulase family glycosylhydrolase [Baekduia sp.]